MNNETKITNDLVRAVRIAMASCDVESMVNLFATDAEWVLIPTGDTYSGLDKIRQVLAGSMKMDFQFVESFYNADQTKLSIEYLHNMVVTEKWGSMSSSEKPVPGTKFQLKVVWICDTYQGKIVKISEYFDMLTLMNGGTRPNPF